MKSLLVRSGIVIGIAIILCIVFAGPLTTWVVKFDFFAHHLWAKVTAWVITLLSLAVVGLIIMAINVFKDINGECSFPE